MATESQPSIGSILRSFVPQINEVALSFGGNAAMLGGRDQTSEVLKQIIGRLGGDKRRGVRAETGQSFQDASGTPVNSNVATSIPSRASRRSRIEPFSLSQFLDEQAQRPEHFGKLNDLFGRLGPIGL